jgi:hypothetical protein
MVQREESVLLEQMEQSVQRAQLEPMEQPA